MLKAQIIGNIGSDPDMRYSQSGTPMLRFNVASNGRTRDQSGEWKDETTWVRVTVIGKRAESLQNLLRKGTRVFVDGKLEARPWTGQNGQMNAGLEVLANDVEFASSRDDGNGQQQRRPAQGRDDDGLEDAPF